MKKIIITTDRLNTYKKGQEFIIDQSITDHTYKILTNLVDQNEAIVKDDTPVVKTPVIEKIKPKKAKRKIIKKAKSKKV